MIIIRKRKFHIHSFLSPKISGCLQSHNSDAGILQLLLYIINTVAGQDLWFSGQQVLAMKPLPLVQRILGCLTVKWMEGLTFHLYLMPFCPETGSCRWATWYVYRSIWGKAFLRAAELRVSQLSREDPEVRRQEVSLAKSNFFTLFSFQPGREPQMKTRIISGSHLFCPECQSSFMWGWNWGFLFMHQTWSLWSLCYNK